MMMHILLIHNSNVSALLLITSEQSQKPPANSIPTHSTQELQKSACGYGDVPILYIIYSSIKTRMRKVSPVALEKQGVVA
jgi:hypothetical protein